MDSKHCGINFQDFHTIVESVINNAEKYGTFKNRSAWLYTKHERFRFIWESKPNYNPHYVLRIQYDSEREHRWTFGRYEGFDFDILKEHGQGHYLSEAVSMANNTSHKENREGFYL